MTVSRDSALPAYQQIAGDLRAAIAAGRYPAGSRLPGERELARQYGVAAMTVRHGIEVLRAEGIVVSREKRGHFVARVSAADAADGPGAGYPEVMVALRMLREDLRQVHQRLDRLEGRARRPGPPAG